MYFVLENFLSRLRSIYYYAEGGATEAYCSRAVCQSVIPSATHISSLAEN